MMRTLCILSILSACVCLLAGCNIVGPAMVLAQGPPKTEAVVQLAEDKKHLIFIDDLRSRLPKRSLRDLMAQSAEETLLIKKVLQQDKLIAARTVQRAVADDRYGATLPISKIGERAGADIVIYVIIDSWSLTRDGSSVSPVVAGRVKIIDCVNGRRLWPRNDEGYRLTMEQKSQTGPLPTGLAQRTTLEQEVAKRYGVALAQMFFTHETSTSALK